MTKLLTMCGYPGTGKSGLSMAIAERFGYARLSYDDISMELFGITPYFASKEQTNETWNVFVPRRNDALQKGHVVMDITAMNENTRIYLLWQDLPGDVRYCQKYLLWLNAHPEALEKRLAERDWGANVVERWKRKQYWEDPVDDGRIYTLLGPFDNNTPEDRERILENVEADLGE